MKKWRHILRGAALPAVAVALIVIGCVDDTRTRIGIIIILLSAAIMITVRGWLHSPSPDERSQEPADEKPVPYSADPLLINIEGSDRERPNAALETESNSDNVEHVMHGETGMGMMTADFNNDFMRRFSLAVEDRISDPDLSVKSLAALMGVSRAQLYRKVKAYSGCSVAEMIRVIRLREADRLLHLPGATVSGTAYAAGFSSPSYFSRCYKEYFNRPPADTIRDSR